MPTAQQLGRYLLLDLIAYGGMAEIYRAKTFDREGRCHMVAIKRVLAHLVEDDEFMQMMVDEAKISANLHHDNIAELFEFARAGHEYFLAMEYVEGKDLRALIERARQSGPLVPAEQAAWIGMQTALGLHAAHTQTDAESRPLRIVHRDVSPSNVLLGYRGAVKLCDFGIAKATLTARQTKTGVIKGKVKYMSPEQAMGKKLDHRSDLFSLGTVLYEVLTLSAPFVGQTEVEQIFAVRDCRRKPLLEQRPDLPQQLVDIVDRAMSRSRNTRYQSGEEMAGDLRQFLDDYSPGFRRSLFSDYMKKSFALEIENELRPPEDFEVGDPDETKVGENLIAGALGPDAPFTRFLVRPRTGNTNTDRKNLPEAPLAFSRDPAVPVTSRGPQLHNLHTMLIDRAAHGLLPEERVRSVVSMPGASATNADQLARSSRGGGEARRALLDEGRADRLSQLSAPSPAGPSMNASTMLIDRAARGLRPAESPPEVARPIADAVSKVAQTMLIDRAAHGMPPAESARSGFSDLETELKFGSGSLHDAETRLHQLPVARPETAVASPRRGRRPAQPRAGRALVVDNSDVSYEIDINDISSVFEVDEQESLDDSSPWGGIAGADPTAPRDRSRRASSSVIVDDAEMTEAQLPDFSTRSSDGADATTVTGTQIPAEIHAEKTEPEDAAAAAFALLRSEFVDEPSLPLSDEDIEDVQ